MHLFLPTVASTNPLDKSFVCKKWIAAGVRCVGKRGTIVKIISSSLQKSKDGGEFDKKYETSQLLQQEETLSRGVYS